MRQGVQVTGKMSLREGKFGGIAGEAAAGKAVGVTAADVGGERRDQHSLRGGEPGSGGRGGRQSKSGKTDNGINLLRPYVIDLKREVK